MIVQFLKKKKKFEFKIKINIKIKINYLNFFKIFLIIILLDYCWGII